MTTQNGISNGTTNLSWQRDHVWRGTALLAAEARTSPSSSTITTEHFHLDHLGTPRLVTNGNGGKIGYHSYYPFGGELDQNLIETPEARTKFTGHIRDTGRTGGLSLDYMHARSFSASIGRYLSIDPLLNTKRALRYPQAWNRYAYVQNNPLNRTDPDGCEDWGFKRFIKNIANSVGIHWWNDSNARVAYNTAKAPLVKGTPGADAARTAAKIAAREQTSPAGGKLAETMRPMADEASRLSGNPAGGNAAVDLAFASTAARAAGPALAAVSVTISTVRIANAPEGEGFRTMAGESGAMLGAVSFGQGGAWAGASAGASIGAFFGGIGALPGAIVGGIVGLVGGGIVGGELGEQAGHNIYDSTVSPP